MAWIKGKKYELAYYRGKLVSLDELLHLGYRRYYKYLSGDIAVKSDTEGAMRVANDLVYLYNEDELNAYATATMNNRSLVPMSGFIAFSTDAKGSISLWLLSKMSSDDPLDTYSEAAMATIKLLDIGTTSAVPHFLDVAASMNVWVLLKVTTDGVLQTTSSGSMVVIDNSKKYFLSSKDKIIDSSVGNGSVKYITFLSATHAINQPADGRLSIFSLLPMSSDKIADSSKGALSILSGEQLIDLSSDLILQTSSGSITIWKLGVWISPNEAGGLTYDAYSFKCSVKDNDKGLTYELNANGYGIYADGKGITYNTYALEHEATQNEANGYTYSLNIRD